MFRILICIISFVLVFNFTYAQTIYFNKTLDFQNGFERGWTVIELEDTGYIVAAAGWVLKFNGWSGITLMKVDTSGNLTWQKAYGQTGYAYYPGLAGGFTQTINGAYAVGGSITDSATNNSDVLLMRFNSKGDTLWTKTFGGTVNSRITNLAPGFSTRRNSRNPISRFERFRTPKPTVAPSNVLSGKGSRSVSPHTGRTGRLPSFDCPAASIGKAKSEANTSPLKVFRFANSRLRSNVPAHASR